MIIEILIGKCSKVVLALNLQLIEKEQNYYSLRLIYG